MASFLKRSKPKEELPETATGVKQTIQARHGTATFVPKGFTIKIINTYGRQVVDTWAFALHAPPTWEEWSEDNKDENEINEEDEEPSEAKGSNDGEAQKLGKSETGGSSKANSPEDSQMVIVDREQQEEAAKEGKDATNSTRQELKEEPEKSGASESKSNEKEEKSGEDTIAKKDDAEDVAQKGEKKEEKADEKDATNKEPKEPNDEKNLSKEQGKAWSSYLPSIRNRGKQPANVDSKAEEDKSKEEDKGSANMSKSWTSYIPSVRKGKQKDFDKSKSNEQNTWGSYIPSGQGFSSYIKNNDAISSFAALHQRDPTKSVAEQLYDFSKTPVGAAGISVASGSGYASSIYAAYTAYSTVSAKKADQNHPGMEFLSMPHSRVSTKHMTPQVGDVLVTNLRAPLLTLIEDKSPGNHDTLMAACDPLRYRQLGVKTWAEHGSCAENLVLALQELNKQVGLKGLKAIGGDVTINSAPTPLNLFMNVSQGPKGELNFGSPKGQRGDFVRFRAERDVVVVMSACPQDVTDINGKKPMVAHFVVDSPSDDDKKFANQRDKEAQSIIEKARRRTETENQRRAQSFRQNSSSGRGMPSRQPSGQKIQPRKLERRTSSSTISVPQKESQMVESPPLRPKQQQQPPPPSAPARNKPRKLERRGSTPRPPPRG